VLVDQDGEPLRNGTVFLSGNAIGGADDGDLETSPAMSIKQLETAADDARVWSYASV
jgi:hypothetical protein